jgi:membrane protein
VPRLSAALAFYTMLSTAPLLLIVATIAEFAYGPDAARGQLADQIKDLVGEEGARALQTMLANAYHPTTGIWTTIVGVAMLLIGATGVFIELQASLNLIWKALPRPGSGVLAFLRSQLLSFLMILVIGFLLLVSLIASAALTALGNWMGAHGPDLLWRGVEMLVSVGVTTLLFAAIYKLLPDADIAWGDTWVGAALTAALFTLGKFLIGLYLGSSGMGTTYGAAGSLAVFLVWVYYSTMIVFFGAEFTYAYAHRCGSHERKGGGPGAATPAPQAKEAEAARL